MARMQCNLCGKPIEDGAAAIQEFTSRSEQLRGKPARVFYHPDCQKHHGEVPS